VRQSGAHEEDFRLRSSLPPAIENQNASLRLSFQPSDRDVVLFVDFKGARRFGFMSSEFPVIAEFHNMLETATFDPVQPWHGRTFYAFPAEDKDGYSLTINPDRLFLQLSKAEWMDLRNLMRQLWESTEFQPWLQELQMEYGEQG
jgi:hypothetical protein